MVEFKNSGGLFAALPDKSGQAPVNTGQDMRPLLACLLRTGKQGKASLSCVLRSCQPTHPVPIYREILVWVKSFQLCTSPAII